MTRPNFFLIGAARCGSTTLHAHLSSHPEVRMSVPKEPNHYVFARETEAYAGPGVKRSRRLAIKDSRQYERLFAPRPGVHVFGDASMNYIRSAEACRSIRREVPDARLVVILRQPVDRAYSSWVRSVWEGGEPCRTFEAAWEDGPRRERENWFRLRHRGKSLYQGQLVRWFDTFPREQIHVILFEEFRERPAEVVSDLYSFLGVDPAFPVDADLRRNRSGQIRNPLARAAWNRTATLRAVVAPWLPLRLRGRFFTWVASLPRTKASKPPLDPAIRARLTAELEDEIRALESLLDRNLDLWRMR